jgi:hypothetical protein
MRCTACYLQRVSHHHDVPGAGVGRWQRHPRLGLHEVRRAVRHRGAAVDGGAAARCAGGDEKHLEGPVRVPCAVVRIAIRRYDRMEVGALVRGGRAAQSS